ncbi:HD-GYP domain-containing protein [Luteimonas sp. WGS1318]|uniref:HD-GYP domain-containing protein n=1 Tax=Luteimonas sp. WGS1318 TaxID=3366815 RepID=UPI00372D2EC5
MALDERKLAVSDLRTGMYVCRLDRDWEGTPFLLQGVLIDSQDDIDTLSRLCEHVYIDLERWDGPLGLALLAEDASAAVAAPTTAREARVLRDADIRALQGSTPYPEQVEFEQELADAREAHARATAFATRVLDDVRNGRPLSPADVREAVEPMVRSLVRNADAFLWLDTLRERGRYEYAHALGCSALAVAFGRHVGLPEPMLVDLASGALLLDIGKLRVEPSLLTTGEVYSSAQMRSMQTHVTHALALLDESGAVPAHVREMVRTHHEHVDGTGYPAGLAGDAIPLLGRIAAVVDAYDAMTSDRPHRRAVGQHVALQALYRDRGSRYAPEVVEQFMQCMSVYPIGSLVELSTGEVAIVMAQNAARRLQPRVMVLTAPDKRLLEQFHSLDLMVRAHGDEPVRIVAPLPPGAHGLDPVALFL